MTTAPLPFPHTPSAQVGPVVPLPAGVRIDRFVTEGTLHQGPHGFAYRAREAGHQQALVLLECFPRALAIRQPDGAVRARQAGDAIALSVVCEAFVQDARALAAVDHPGVVKVFGVINANRTVYRVMPFIDGQTLEEQRIERPEAPTVGGLVRLYDKLLDALEALHRAGFVHGLVQPDQILMRHDDNAPVLLGMDGVAIELGEVTMSPWAAPEQQQSLRFERVNASADLYMLAATMVFAATGAAPPRAEERLAGDTWDPTPALAAVPLGGGDAPALRDALIQAVTASLALAAPARPQRADDVRHILHPGSSGGFVASTGPAPLWVGEVPDRDSQWETLEGMSGPVPLRSESETQMVFDPADVARAEAMPRGVPGDPVVAPAARATRRAEGANVVSPGRRATDAGRSSSRIPRRAWLAFGGGMLMLFVVLWWSQHEGSADVPTGIAPPATTPRTPPVAAAPVATPTPAPPTAAIPAPVVQDSAPTPAPPPMVSVVPATAPPSPSVALAAPAAPTPVPAAVVASPPAPPAKVAAPPPRAPVAAPAPKAAAPKAAAAKPPAKPTAKPAPPTRTAKPAAPAQRTAAAESLCGNRTQFSYLYCMQDACARAAQRNNAQCAALRRNGDIR
jgi:non-specific serine/threonine protein kinase